MTVETQDALELTVNGAAATTRAGSLAALVAEMGLTGSRVATACNGDFVPSHARADCRLRTGDKIEIVAPRHGG